VPLSPYAIALRGRSPAGVKRWRFPARAVQSLWRRTGWPSITKLTGSVDLVHATNFVLPVLPDDVPGVVTVHDLSFLRDDTFPGGERLQDLVPWSVDRAARVLTPSHAVGKEVTERYGLEPDKVRAIHEGVAPIFFSAAPLADSTLAGMGISRPYALAVGTLEPRKNLARLLEAWTLARGDLEGWTLVIAGPPGWGPGLPEVPGVVLHGWVGDETLPGLLAAAELFCYPSLYEGFGLPPLEAMAASTPVLAGDYSAAREVLGDAAVFVDPLNSEDIAVQLGALVADEDLRMRLVRAGRARAAGFSWARAAQETLKAYYSVL
jgi:glycosyltransferase involved in cell wall biosynthesis